MIGRFFHQLRRIFRARSLPTSPPRITDRSTLREVTEHYPHFPQFLALRYGVSLADSDSALTLLAFVEKHALPQPRIVFMECQLAEQMARVRAMPATEARERIAAGALRVIDVRECWEHGAGRLPGARALDGRMLSEMLGEWPRETPLLVYCHFGVRSLDAALYLSAEGFTQVYTLQGGIDAWSQQVDPSIPRYAGSYC